MYLYANIQTSLLSRVPVLTVLNICENLAYVFRHSAIHRNHIIPWDHLPIFLIYTNYYYSYDTYLCRPLNPYIYISLIFVMISFLLHLGIFFLLLMVRIFLIQVSFYPGMGSLFHGERMDELYPYICRYL